MSRSFKDFLKENSRKFLLPLAGLFLFILPIPHTLTIRETALFISLIILLVFFRRHAGLLGESLASLRLQAALYIAFVAWVLFVALFVSKDTVWALKEIKTQWVMGTLALFFGAGLATLSRSGLLKIRTLMAVIYWTLAAHVLAINTDGVYRIISKLAAGEPYHGLTALTAGVGGLTIGPIDGSLLASLFFVFILSEVISRFIYHKRFLPVPGPVLAVSFLLVISSSVLTGMRNIVEVPVVIAGTLFILFVTGGGARKKALYSCLVIVPLLIGAVIFFYRSDARWAEVGESLDLVMKQEEPARALAFSGDFVYPRLHDNRPVNISNFIRFTKYRVGLEIIKSRPLGIGFGRNAFGHYLKARYNKGVGLNSDSSLIDMTVGAGLPGVALFGAIVFSILALSIGAFRKTGDFYALLLSLVIICFGARMVFDSVLRDHLLEILMFITGLLATRVSVIGSVPALTLKEGRLPYGEVSGEEQKLKAV